MVRIRSAWTRIRTYPPWTRLSGCIPQKSGRRTISGWKGRIYGRVNRMTHLPRFQRFLSDWRGSNSRLYRLNLMNYLTAVINVVYCCTPWYIFEILFSVHLKTKGHSRSPLAITPGAFVGPFESWYLISTAKSCFHQLVLSANDYNNARFLNFFWGFFTNFVTKYQKKTWNFQQAEFMIPYIRPQYFYTGSTEEKRAFWFRNWRV